MMPLLHPVRDKSMSEQSPKGKPSASWSDIAPRLFLVGVLLFVIWLVRSKFG